MFQNYHLLEQSFNQSVSQVQFLQQYLYDHEIRTIKELVRDLPFQKAEINGSNSSQGLNFRQSSIKWIEWNDHNWWLYTKLTHKLGELNKQIWNFDLYGINEYIQYTEYDGDASTRGHYDWHMDIGNQGIEATRKLTMEVILESDHRGGEFSVLMGPTEHKVNLQKGDAVIYPSYLLNKTYPVISGNRKSIICWFSGPAFK